MLSYKFARRSFLRGIGAASGLKIMLNNLEASAQGAPPPPRFFMTHFTIGTQKPDFLPGGANGTNFTFSRILKPFETAGLRDQMIVLYGLDNTTVGGFGGGHERGTVMMTTAVAPPGTRAGETEADDSYAGGPSMDQIFLKNVPALYKANSGKGYANAICDSRVDFQEISNQCLSYGYTTQPQAAARGMGPQNTPLLPELSPLNLFMSVFSGFMPGGGTTPGNMDALKKALMQRKSVLDFALRELKTMKTLAPASEASKIDVHTAAVQTINSQITAQIASGAGGAGGGTGGGNCVVPTMPDNTIGGRDDRKDHDDYKSPTTVVSDEATHEKVGLLHTGIIRAAFQCDLMRVATFQWSPGTNHVSFKGLYPGEPNTSYMHHPISHRITSANDLLNTPSAARQADVTFLSNVQTWYMTRMATIINQFKDTIDVFGGSLLDHTIIPYVTEVGECTHHYNNIPALIFGGSKLGMQLGQFQNLGSRFHTDLWLTIAQAYGLDVTKAPLSLEKFAQIKTNFSGPIAGLWKKPV